MQRVAAPLRPHRGRRFRTLTPRLTWPSRPRRCLPPHTPVSTHGTRRS